MTMTDQQLAEIQARRDAFGGAVADVDALIAEVAELRGLLADLAIDSRAAAEVVRLRKEVGEIAEACERREAWSGFLLSGRDIAKHLRDAIAPPPTQKPGGT